MSTSNTKNIFDQLSIETSKATTKKYSTSFAWAIHCLDKKFHNAIYSIYGFVRCADEIVDTFHQYDKKILLDDFKQQTYQAIERKISLNPILNSFQQVVHNYKIDFKLIDCFLKSMETDLHQATHSKVSYDQYIVGSAEVVGLMCLKVFTENNVALYESLKPAAMKLGAAFQKVNFLRDLKNDYEILGRTYFPSLNINSFSEKEKKEIENEIKKDFIDALNGIKNLPLSSRFGIYTAYSYYKKLFRKIESASPSTVMNRRIRIPNHQKIRLLIISYFRNKLHLLN